MHVSPPSNAATVTLPNRRQHYYGGAWHDPKEGRSVTITCPGSGGILAEAALSAARDGFGIWRDVPPLERAKILRRIAAIVRQHAREFAMIDAADCGNPVTATIGDADIASAQLDFFAGLVTEMKGASIPMGPGVVNFSLREPRGIVAKILPFNHPFMFCAGKIAAPLAAGNSAVVKPPEQAPLSVTARRQTSRCEAGSISSPPFSPMSHRRCASLVRRYSVRYWQSRPGRGKVP